MIYIFDTNICIYLIKKKYPKLLDKTLATNPDNISLSSVVKAELRYAAEKSEFQARNHSVLDLFLWLLNVINFDQISARCYGRIRADLEKKGKIIVAYDLMIGAHALATNSILITNNVREFSRIKGLKIENWTK